MFKRVTWLSVGLVAGFGASKWVERKARRRLARYLPSARLDAGMEAAAKARERAATKVADFRHAVEGGRQAMVAREAELRHQLRLDEGEPAGPGSRAVGQGGPRPLPPAAGAGRV